MNWRKVYFDGIRVGDELTPLPISLDRVAISRWAGATEDYNPLFVDEPYARRAGFPSPCVPGPLLMAHLGELAAAWLQPGRVKRLSVKYRRVLWPDDAIAIRGRVVAKRREEGECYVDLELWAENERGEQVLRGELTSLVQANVLEEDRRGRGIAGAAAPGPGSLVEAIERELSFDEGVLAPPARRSD